MDYQANALAFAKRHGVKLNVIDYWYGTMPYWGDGVTRCVFTMQIARDHKRYTFKFGQSTAKGSKEPTMYDVLACLTKYDPGTFENFCSDYGYDTDSRSAERTYKAVCKEWQAVERLFGDIIEELQEIQ